MKSRKKKKQNTFLKRLFFFFLLVINLVVAFPLLLSFLAQYIPPSFSEWVAIFGLAFPYLLLANAIFCLVWLFFKYQYILISLSLILLNVNTIDKHYQLREREKPEKCANCIKIMSYNVKLFDLYNQDSEQFGKGKEEIFAYLAQEKPEIVCFQEYFYEKGDRFNFVTTDSILSILNLNNDKKYYYQYFPYQSQNELFYGFAIFSKYRIIDAQPVQVDSTLGGAAIYVDIKYRGDTIRVYNVHLASIYMDEYDYETGRQLRENINDPEYSKKAKHILKKLNKAFLNREKEIKSLTAHIDSCYYPLIICGDFNDTPASYAYNKLAKNMKDAFRVSGKGESKTFNGETFPEYRIDYILYDKKYKAYGYTISDTIFASDHFPIYTYISLSK